MSAPSPAPLPRLGTEAEFLALREALDGAGYTEEAVRRRAGIERISSFPLESKYGPVPDDPLGVLIWLFMHGATISREAAGKIPIALLRVLGLAVEHPSGHGFCSPVLLYPLRGVYVASDRPTPFDGQPHRPHDDFVYPAITPNTELFLDLVPFGPCDALLDLCAGTGAGAMIAVRHGAKKAWSCDLTERSTHFAEFNRLLNGLDAVVASCGDLYEAAGAETFDRIVAHPPYVAVPKHQFIFDSGGEDGEQVVRGIIQGLPRRLRPGGRFFALTMGTDRKLPFEQRIRGWLGAAADEFDVSLTTRRVRSLQDYTAEMAIREGSAGEHIRSWRENLKSLGVEDFVYGFVAIQRRDRPRPVFTVRRKSGARTGRAENEWLLDWETRLASEGAAGLLEAKLRAAPETRLTTGHRLVNQGWAPESFLFELEHPFDMEFHADAWAAYLLASCDGTRTGADVLAKLKNDGVLAADTPPLEFARMLGTLVSGGFLEI
jgi:SAM-dependent methyltransferase